MLTIHIDHLSGDAYLGDRVAPAQIAEVRLNRWPPEVVLNDGRIGFVDARHRRDLRSFARLHGVPEVVRDDVWADLTEPFLDTGHSEAAEAAGRQRLAANGLGAEEVTAIRGCVGPLMTMMTVMTWEWCHYGLYDVLIACGRRWTPAWGSSARYLPPWGSLEAFRRWAEGIANRAPIRGRGETGVTGLEPAFLTPNFRADDPNWPVRTEAFATVRAALTAAWSEPHRRYHNPHHLSAVLTAVDGAQPRAAFVLAAWFHDAVYEPERNDNEVRSAAWLVRAVGPWVASGDVEAEHLRLAERMVLATADPLGVSADDPDRDAILRFLDADFGIFAAVPQVYDAYVAGVREEFGFVPDPLFNAGRGAFLERLAAAVTARGWFFYAGTPFAEAMAKQNLARERGLLRIG